MDSDTWKIARGVALGILIAVAIVVLLVSCQANRNKDQCLLDNIDQAQNGQPIEDCGD